MGIDLIKVEERTHYVFFGYAGTFETKAMMRTIKNALRITAEKARKAALLDIRELGGAPPTTSERYDLGVFGATHNPDLIWMAVLGKEPILEPQRFAETVAANRGAQARVFEDMDEATTWLEACVNP